MAYSMDLRVRVLAIYDRTGSSAEAARHHDVSASWVRRLVQRRRETGGSIAPRSSARRTSSRVYDAADEAAIRGLIAARPDVTLAEIAARLGKPAGLGTVHRAVTRLDLPRKKSPRTPPNATGPTSKPGGRPGSRGSPA
jgi:transposase